MPVTASGPVNPAQLVGQLASTTGAEGVLAIQGDPANAGATVWSSQWSDAQISAALAAVTYEAPAQDPAAVATAAVQTFYTQIPTKLAAVQSAAATISAMTAGQAPTAAQASALATVADAVATLLSAASDLSVATRTAGAGAPSAP